MDSCYIHLLVVSLDSSKIYNKQINDMAECTINGVRHRLKEGGIPLQMKFDGNILEVWYQE